MRSQERIALPKCKYSYRVFCGASSRLRMICTRDDYGICDGIVLDQLRQEEEQHE